MERHLWSSTVDLYTEDDPNDEQAEEILQKFETDWDACMGALFTRLQDGGYLKTFRIDEQSV